MSTEDVAMISVNLIQWTCCDWLIVMPMLQFSAIKSSSQPCVTAYHTHQSPYKYSHYVMRESNRNLDTPPPPPGIPGEFACLVFEEGGHLNFFLVEGGEFA
jgi:hypothetical protein